MSPPEFNDRRQYFSQYNKGRWATFKGTASPEERAEVNKTNAKAQRESYHRQRTTQTPEQLEEYRRRQRERMRASRQAKREQGA